MDDIDRVDEVAEVAFTFLDSINPTQATSLMLTRFIHHIAEVYNEMYGVTNELRNDTTELQGMIQNEWANRFGITLPTPNLIPYDLEHLIRTFAGLDRDHARQTLAGHHQLGYGRQRGIIRNIASYLGP